MADSPAENSPLKCRTCGGVFAAPPERRHAIVALIEEESAHCNRMREIKQQRQALAASIEAGIAVTRGADAIDTNDLVAHRQSLAQLDGALIAEAAELAKAMIHVPAQWIEETGEP